MDASKALSDRRTALVTGDSPRPCTRSRGGFEGAFLAEPGVVGRLSKMRRRLVPSPGRRAQGYIRAGHFWGLDADGTLE